MPADHALAAALAAELNARPLLALGEEHRPAVRAMAVHIAHGFVQSSEDAGPDAFAVWADLSHAAIDEARRVAAEHWGAVDGPAVVTEALAQCCWLLRRVIDCTGDE